MSLGRPVVPVNPNEYQRNNAQFDQMQQLLNELRTANDEGFLEYERRERELRQRVEAGELARREQQRQQMLVEDAERASRELAQLQTMRNQLLITNGNSGGVAPQPLASSSARIEELPSTPNRVATTNNPSRHHHVQQIPSNHNQRPHLQNNPYIYAQQATYSQYPTIIQYQPNTSSSSTSQNQARHTGSSVYGWSQKPISYNAPLSHLPRNNPAPNLNAMPAAGTSSINGVPETRATPQPSVSSGNTHSSVLGDLSRVTGPGPFNEQQRLELFAEIVNAWAKTAQDNAEVYLDQLQLWLVKGNPSQNARSVSVKVRDPSGEMRAATREELVLRIRRAYGGYDTRSQPDRQSVHTHRSAPQDRALAQTAQIPSISHPSATSSSGLYTSIPLPPHASASRPSPVQAPLQNMNNLPPISTPSSSTAAGSPSTSLLRTPAQANKSTLAQDILRGFGGPKRPRSNDGDPNGRDPKRQALSDEGPTNSVQQPLHSSNQTQSTSQQAEVVQQAHSIPQPVPRLPQPVSPKTQPITKTPAKARKPESLVEAGSDAGPILLAQKEAPETKSAETATPDAEEVTSPLAPTLDHVHPISSPSPPNAAIEPSTPLTRRVSGAGSQPGSSKRPESFIVEETPPPSPMQRPGTPLFLASPAPSSSSVVILDGPPSPKSPTRANLRKGEKDTGQRRSVLRLRCVELPPAPAWVKHDLELSKQKRKKGKEREQVPVHRFLHRNVVISDSEEELLADDNAAKHSLAARVQEALSSQAETPEKDPEELEIMNLAKSRLESLSCKWQSCDAVMNSVARLEHHLVNHVKDMVRQKSYTCQWQKCAHQESRRGRLAQHVVSHVLSSLPCPYEECKESFQHVHRLLQHSRRHHRNSRTRPSAEPFTPTLSSPPECPDYLPSYMVITRQIVPRSIPRERHVANGPRVLQNIIPPTSWKRGTLSPSNHKRRGQKSPVTEDEYEFITYRASASYRPSTSAKVDKLGNLPSTLVSELVGGGLTLWKDGVRVALGDEKRVMESEIKETPATEITPVQ